jgi:hypothetical protein
MLPVVPTTRLEIDHSDGSLISMPWETVLGDAAVDESTFATIERARRAAPCDGDRFRRAR